MTSEEYKTMVTDTIFIRDNMHLIKALLEYEDDSMTYNRSNYTRVAFAIDNSIELLEGIKEKLEHGRELI